MTSASNFNSELQKRLQEVIKQLAKEYPDVRGDIQIKIDFVSK